LILDVRSARERCRGGDVMRVVDLTETFGRFADAWSPKIVGDVNDMHVKVVKLRGEFVWHHHDAEDELFLVVAGGLRLLLQVGASVSTHGARYRVLRPSDQEARARRE